MGNCLTRPAYDRMPEEEQQNGAKQASAPVSCAPEKREDIADQAQEGLKPLKPMIDEDTANRLIDFAKCARWDPVCELLDKYDGAVDVRPPYREYNILHQAAWHGSTEDCKMLLDDYSADPRAKTKHGQLPSDVALQQGYHTLAGLLRTYEDEDTRWIKEAMGLAKEAKWEPLFAFLDEHKHLVNFRPSHHAQNILHQAAGHGDVTVCKRLIDEYGANPWLLSKTGERASQVAQEKGFPELAAVLLGYEQKSLTEGITLHVTLLSGEVLLGDVWVSVHDTVGHLRQLAHEEFQKKGGADDAVVAALVTASGKSPLDERKTIQEAGLIDGTSVTAITQVDELYLIEAHFHQLIMDRNRVTDKEELTKKGFTWPNVKQMVEKGGKGEEGTLYYGSWPVPGMYGGFSGTLVKEETPEVHWKFTCESRCRVVEGSGQRHEITAKGGVKLLADGLL